MNKLFLLLFVLSSASRADIFAFHDLEGFEKCLQSDHLVDTTKTSGGAQTKFLSGAEVKNKCVAAAASMLSSEKDKAKIIEFIKTAKRATAHEETLDLVNLVVKGSKDACNDMEVYMVIHKALSGPKDTALTSYYSKAKKAVKTCLADKEFKKDFLEEKDSTDSYLSANACEILLEEKLVKSCKKG